MTLVEMQEAFRKGAGKEYGDYFGITYASMLGFLRGYLKSEKKIRATQIVSKHLQEKQKELDAMTSQRPIMIESPAEMAKTRNRINEVLREMRK